MDPLDDLIIRCQTLASGDDPAATIRDAVESADLAAVGRAVLARPKPWFFHTDDHLTVFATQGQPGTGSAPHDHGLWAVLACLEGSEGSRRYEARSGQLVETGLRRLDPGDVHGLAGEAIHAVFNCWTEPNLVLHLYGGDFLAASKHVWDPISGARSALGLAQPLAPIDGGQ